MTALLISSATVGQTPSTSATPAATQRIPFTTAKPALARLDAADEARLKAMIAQHQRLRSRLSVEDRALLDKLTIQVRKQLFAAPLRGNLLVSATQAVSRIIPDFTKQEAAILAEYVLGGIASNNGETSVSAGSSNQAGLASSTNSIQEMQHSFNLQYLQLQNEMQHENRQYELISNIMKTKHDTAKNSISNIR